MSYRIRSRLFPAAGVVYVGRRRRRSVDNRIVFMRFARVKEIPLAVGGGVLVPFSVQPAR